MSYSNARLISRTLAALTLGALCFAATAQVLDVVTADSDIVANRLVFSTINYEIRSPKTVTLKNTGSQAVVVNAIAFGDSREQSSAVVIADHLRGVDFTLVGKPVLPATIQPGGTLLLNIRFAPKRLSSVNPNDVPTHTLNGESYATLQVSTAEPLQSTLIVDLAGFQFVYYEGQNEPSVAEISRIFGFTQNIGTEKLIIGGAKKLLGDEVYSPYWIRPFGQGSGSVKMWGRL